MKPKDRKYKPGGYLYLCDTCYHKFALLAAEYDNKITPEVQNNCDKCKVGNKYVWARYIFAKDDRWSRKHGRIVGHREASNLYDRKRTHNHKEIFPF